MKCNIQIFKNTFSIKTEYLRFTILTYLIKKINFKKFPNYEISKTNNSSLLNLLIKYICIRIYTFYIRLKLNHFCCTNDIVAFTCSRVGTKYCDRQSGIYMKIWNFLITLSPCLILHTRPVLQFFIT